MKKILISIVLLLVYHAHGQQAGVVATQNPSVENDPFANFHQRWNPMMEKLFQLVRDDDGIVTHYVGAEVGSPYENDSYEKGEVWYEDEKLADVYYRYNVFSKEIEIKKTRLPEEKHQVLLRDGQISLIKANTPQEYLFLPFKTRKGSRVEDYLVSIFKGDTFELYKHLESKFTEAKPAANSMVAATPSKFTTFYTYFLRSDGGEINEISMSKNKFLKGIPSAYTNEMKAFLKEEKIDLDNESQLIRAVTHMDRLAMD